MMGVLLAEISEDGDLKRYIPPAQDSKFAAPIGYEPRRFEIPPTQDSKFASQIPHLRGVRRIN